MHQCIQFILFWNDTLHVPDGLSVHHQEFKTVRTATGVCQILLSACWVQECTYINRHMSDRYCCVLASKQTAVSVWHACCCMYSLELLMMDGRTVRNI